MALCFFFRRSLRQAEQKEVKRFPGLMTKEEKERLGYSIVLVDVPMRMTTERRYEQQITSFNFGFLFLLHVQPAMESNKATRNHNVGNPLFNAKTYLFDASSSHCPCALNSGLPTL